jgi:hypothetical protein
MVPQPTEWHNPLIADPRTYTAVAWACLIAGATAGVLIGLALVGFEEYTYRPWLLIPICVCGFLGAFGGLLLAAVAGRDLLRT